MEKKAIKFKTVILGILLVIAISAAGFLVQYQAKTSQNTLSAKTVNHQAQIPVFSYKGQEGKDALTLLKQNAVIELGKSGMVTAINNRKADNIKHEYWAFYVNGKQAVVGPADYTAKNGDFIEWKIEKY